MIMKDKNKVLQYAGGGLIVAAAFALMLPGWLFYLAGLWRIISLVVTMLVVAWLVVYIYHKLCPPKKNQSRQPANNGVNEPSSDEGTEGSTGSAERTGEDE